MAEKLRGRTKENHAGVAIRADKLAKEFVMISPDGTVHQGKNVAEFCKEHDLRTSKVYRVFGGDNAHHKGWTGHYVQEEPLFSAYFHD